LPDVILPLRGTFVALSFGSLLVTSLAAKPESTLCRIFSSRAMCFLGTRSYGLYVFHGIIAYGMGQHQTTLDRLASRLGPTTAMVVEATVGAGVSVLVATASYELFEKHFLRLKSRLAPSTGVRTEAILDARPAQ
jgi:peptidoglycan/LPS O-acetylase OafA/YrhL